MVMFENGVGQAIHFAYMICQYPDTPVSQIAEMIRVAIKKDGAKAYAKTASRLNFDGLTGHEIRAQAALIRLAVDKLPSMQSLALKARHCHGLEKTGAIGHLLPMLPKMLDNAGAQGKLLHQQYGYPNCSGNEIAREFAVDRRHVTRASVDMKVEIARLEMIAYASLEAQMSGCDLID